MRLRRFKCALGAAQCYQFYGCDGVQPDGVWLVLGWFGT